MHFRVVEPNMPRLIVRSPFLAQEPLHLACLRITALNGLGNLSWLTSLARLPRSFHSAPCDLRPLAEILDVVDSDDLAAAAAWPDLTQTGFIRSFAGCLPSYAIDVASPKVCPTCLANGMHCDPIWDLRSYRACAVHGCHLIEECPRCNRPLTLFRKSPSRCACGGDLAAAPTAHANERLVAISRLLAALIHAPSSHTLPISDALRLLWFIGTTEVDNGAWRALFISRPRGGTMDHITEAAAPCLLNWPGEFQEWLVRHWRIVPGKTGIADEYDGLPGRLRAAFDRNSPVLKEAGVAIARNAEGSPVRPTSFFYQRDGTGAVVTGAAGARQLGVTTARLTRLARTHGLAANARTMGRRHLHLIAPREIDRLRELDADIVTRAEAALLLGISQFQVDSLVRVQILPIERGPLRSGVRKAAVQALLESLYQRCCEAPSPLISLADLPNLRHRKLVDVLAAILDGRISVHVRDVTAPSLARFGIVASALTSFRIKPSGSITLSVREAASHIGVSTRMVTALVRARCLQRACDASSKSGVTSASVETFRRDYIMATELARSLRTSTKVVARRIAANGTHAVLPSDCKRGISAVWRRSDIKNMTN